MFIYAVYWREKLRTNASVIFIIFCLVLGVACAPSSVDRGEGYWVPVDPPKCHYEIDVKVDLDVGFIEGKETVILPNDSNRAIEVVAFDWRKSADYSIDVTARGENLVVLKVL